MDRDLLKVARSSIKKYLGLPYEDIEVKSEWNLKRATFVTLEKNGKLRGCIGSLEARRSLYDDIKENAISAGFRDPRFFPLQEDEISKIKIEISILTPLKEITFESENEILNRIVPFKMGLLLEYGYNRGTFLPQVWEYYPEPKDFFNHLKQKAGLREDFYSDDMKLYYYEVEKCQE